MRSGSYALYQGQKGLSGSSPEMVLLDKSTGRLMEMTKLQGGLHQAVEAKEHVKLS